MSPAVNTPGTLVIHRSSRHTLPRSVSRTPSCSSMPARSGPTKPMARRTRRQGRVNSVPDLSLKRGRPATIALSISPPPRPGAAAPGARAARVADEALGRDGVDALAALGVRGGDAVDVWPGGPGIVGGAALGGGGAGRALLT